MRLSIQLSTLLLLASANALAQTPPPPPMPPMPPARFEQHKAALMAKLQAHIAREQAMLSCVQAAANHAALKACKHMPPR